MKFTCIHTDTSGLDPDTGEILALSYQSWSDFTKGPLSTDRFRAVGLVTAPAFAEAAKHNGYDDAARLECATLRGGFLARCFDEVAKTGTVLVARPMFWSFVCEAARRMGVPVPANVRVIDLPSLCVPLLAAGKVEGLALYQLCKLAGKELPHTATSSDKVERTIDVFETTVRAYVKALVAP